MASGPIHGPGAVGRIRALLAARLSAAGPGGTPIAAVFLLAVVVGALCAMVSDHLPPFAYGVLSISLACEDDAFMLPDIEQLLGEKLECEQPPAALLS